MPRKLLEEATALEIRTFAAAQCGLDIHENASRAVAAARLKTLWDHDYIEVSEEGLVDDAVARAQAGIPVGRNPDDAWYRIKIARSDVEDDEDQLVEVGVNGVIQLLPRGKEIELRAPFLEVLRRAVQHRYRQASAEDEMVMYEVPLYPLEYVSDPYFKTAVPQMAANDNQAAAEGAQAA